MTRAEAEALAAKIVYLIEGWCETELRASRDYDGDGHYDFGGFRVRERGKASLIELLMKGEP